MINDLINGNEPDKLQKLNALRELLGVKIAEERNEITNNRPIPSNVDTNIFEPTTMASEPQDNSYYNPRNDNMFKKRKSKNHTHNTSRNNSYNDSRNNSYNDSRNNSYNDSRNNSLTGPTEPTDKSYLKPVVDYDNKCVDNSLFYSAEGILGSDF